MTAVLLLGLGWAQPLASMLPAGSVAGLTLSSSRDQPQLSQLGRDWLESGLEEALSLFLKSVRLEPELLGLAQGGLAAALYPQGEIFLIAQPSEATLAWFRLQTQGGSLQGGWRSRILADQPLMVGLNQRQVVVASPAQWRRFLAGQRGPASPQNGQLVLWLNRPATLASPDQLPPTLLNWLNDLEQWVWSVRLTPQGLETEGRLRLGSQASRTGRAFWLGSANPWSVDALPAAPQVSSGLWNPGIMQQLLNSLLGELGLEEQFSLAGLGQRYATLTPQVSGRQGQAVWMLEVVQRTQAEASLQSLARWLTAFTDPAGRPVGWSSPNSQGLRQLDLGVNGPVYMLLENSLLYLATEATSLLSVARSTRKGQWPEGLAGRIPANVSGYSFGPPGGLGIGLGAWVGDSPADALGLVGAPPALGRALEKWLDALAPRLGNSWSYSQVRGNELITVGFSAVRWSGR